MKYQRKLQQIDVRDWPLGLEQAIAVVALEPPVLSARCGVHFQESEDELDRLEGASVSTGQGKVFALVRHRGAPASRTEVSTSSASAGSVLV